MAQYGILRFEKHKGAPAGALEAHHERRKDQYASNPDVDKSRSKDNFHIIQPAGRYRQEIDSRIKAAGCRTRKDSTRFVDTLITASPDFFYGKKREDIAAYFRRAAEFLCRRVGKQNVISAVVHMDEKTPHLHLTFVPLTEDNRLSAKEILGNRVSLSKWQDDFHAHMSAAYPDLERGESAWETGRTHIPTRIFKQAVRLTKQAQKIQETLDSISPFNAVKKREEAAEMLHKWFPQMENFEAYLKKYQAALLQLKKDNAALVERAEENSAIRVDQRLEIGQLQSDLRKLQRFVDAIPPEMMERLRGIRRQRQKEQYREER